MMALGSPFSKSRALATIVVATSMVNMKKEPIILLIICTVV